MAERELSILVKAKGALQAAQQIGKVDKATRGLGKAGKIAAAGIGAGVAIGAVLIGRSVRSGLESLATLEDATTSVAGAISDLNIGTFGEKERNLTSGLVAQWANEIEANIDAAFDDKDIVQASTTLLRFGKVTPDNLRPAMQVMTDLATKTGSVDSAATQLAKALADPTKAAGKLARNGIILTKAEQDQIAVFMKAGDVAAAQGVIITSLSKTTAGAAKAMHGPYRDSMLVLADVTEDAQRALAEGFMPVIMEVRDILTEELGKPGALDRIRDLGKGLAGGLRGLVDVAKGLPWGQIGDAFKLMGTGAKAALDMFTSMPPWVQTAILTGWGLNKLTGGMLGTVVGELGKGLIKGVLGMTAGVVNINAGVVNGGGVLPTPGRVGPQSLLSMALGTLPVLMAAAIPIAIGAGLGEWAKSEAAKDPEIQNAVKVRERAAAEGKTLPGARGGPGTLPKSTNPFPVRVVGALMSPEEKAAAQRTQAAINTSRINTIAATRTGDASIVAAIRGIMRPIVNVNVSSTTVRVRSYSTGTTLNRYTGKLVPIG